MPDLVKYPELRWLDRHPFFPPFVLGLIVLLCGGWGAFFFAFGLANIGVWHLTYTINSLAHIVGSRRFATEDSSRNFYPLAVLLLGEGWHNNHHAFPTSIRQGLYWWEIDITYYFLKILSFTGLVRGLKYPPRAAYAHKRVRDGHLDLGMLHTYTHRIQKIVQRLGRRPDMQDERKTLLDKLQTLTKEAERIARGRRRIQ